MVRSRFDEQLVMLNRELTEMGALCEEVISIASDALVKGDTSLAHSIEKFATEIDTKERDIESLCMKLLLQQQPVARDLRQISAALKMITDMERIGDQAEDIAEIIDLLDGKIVDECEDIRKMAVAVIKMVTESVEAFVARDVELAKKVEVHDDAVDEYFVKVKDALIDIIVKDPQEGQYALDLMMIAKYFERIGDHAVNIAEWVVFSVTGEHKGAN